MLILLFATTSSKHVVAQTAAAGRGETLTATVRAAEASRVSYVASPISFEPNRGQDTSGTLYVAQAHGYVLRLDKAGARVEMATHAGARTKLATTARQLGLRFVDSEARGLSAKEMLQGVHSYFPSGDPATWTTNVPTFARVNYEGVYRGVDVSFYGRENQLEYDFILQPHANARQIALALDGADAARMEKNGDVRIAVGDDAMTLRKPVAYQVAANGRDREPVTAAYRLVAADAQRHRVACLLLNLGRYDRNRELVIDPVMLYGSNIPGASGFSYPPYYFPDTIISAMTADAHGNTYVAANIRSSNAAQSVMKFDPSGKLLLNVTFGGTSASSGTSSIAVDGSGNIYLAGQAGAGFPVTAGAFQSTGPVSYTETGTLMVIRGDGTALIYSSYFGSTGGTVIRAVAVDGSGMAYVTGSTSGTGFPTTAGVYEASVASSYSPIGFVAKFNPKASGAASVVYSTYLGPAVSANDSSYGASIAVDKQGEAFVALNSTTDFPVTPGSYNFEGSPTYGAYIVKLNAAATGLVHSAFLGPGLPSGIAVDGSYAAYVTGSVGSADFPTTAGAYQTSHPNGFASKLSPDFTTLVYSTFLGGPSSIQADIVNPVGIAIPAGCASACGAFIGGYTSDQDFPLILPLQSFFGTFVFPQGSIPVTGFLVGLASDGKSAAYSTYLGAAHSTSSPTSIAADTAGNVYYAANVQGADAPTSPYTILNSGGGFIAKIGPADASATIVIPNSFNFNPEPVHGSLKNAGAVLLRNMGSLPANLTKPFAMSSSEFTESDNCGSILAPGAACPLDLTFTPSATGQRNGTMTIATNGVNSPIVLSLSGMAMNGSYIDFSAASLSYIDRLMGTVSGTLSVTMTNSGNMPQIISSIATTLPDYKLTSNCPTTLAAGGSCKLNVVFAPTQIGLRSGYIQVQFPVGSAYPYGLYVALTGTGMANAAGSGTLTLSENSLNFGNVLTGSGTGQSVTLMNTGAAPFALNSLALTVTEGSAGDFALVPPVTSSFPTSGSSCGSSYNVDGFALPADLGVQQSCYLMISFRPSMVGQETATISIGDSAAGSPHKISLSGMGLKSTQSLSVSPANLTFPAQPLGEASATQTLTLMNTGNTTITIYRVYATGDFGVLDGNCYSSTLAPMEACSAAFTFKPTAIGMRTGTAAVLTSASSDPQVFNMVGAGMQATGALAVGQTSLVFPGQAQGTTSVIQQLSISNPGNSPITINTLAPTGDFMVSPYNYTGVACGGVLAPDTTCEASITFTPTQSPGTETGSLTVHSTAGQVKVALSGVSLAANKSIRWTPSAADFGSLKPGTNTTYQSYIAVYLENTGNEPVTFSGVPTITAAAGTPAGDFFIAYSLCYNSLAPGASCAVSLAFNPTKQGAEQASVSIASDAGTQTLTVSGTGVATAPVANIEPATLTFPLWPTGVPRTASDIESVELVANTTQAVTIQSVAISSGGSDFAVSTVLRSCVGSQVSKKSPCSIGINFQPSVVGYRTGVLTVKDTAGGCLHGEPRRLRCNAGPGCHPEPINPVDAEFVGTVAEPFQFPCDFHQHGKCGDLDGASGGNESLHRNAWHDRLSLGQQPVRRRYFASATKLQLLSAVHSDWDRKPYGIADLTADLCRQVDSYTHNQIGRYGIGCGRRRGGKSPGYGL